MRDLEIRITELEGKKKKLQGIQDRLIERIGKLNIKLQRLFNIRTLIAGKVNADPNQQ